MKRNIIITLVVFVVLAATTLIIVISKGRSTTLQEKESNFAVNDTASITKIFLADKENNTILLRKTENGSWLVNEKYPASREQITMILKTIMSIEVKEPVPIAARQTVMTLLATTSIKVEIYQKVYRIDLFGKIRLFPYEKRTKTYFVGMPTQDNLGTFMLMDKAETPYITYIFGFNGFLTSRYSTKEKDWRDHTIFDLKYKHIKSYTIRFYEKPENSFKVIKNGPKEFELYALQDNRKIYEFDTLRIMDLFASFSNIRFETLLNDMEPERKDSIINSKPYIELSVVDTAGREYNLISFLRKAPPDEIDQQGKPILYDRDRLYALINNRNDFVMIQFFVFEPLFKPLNYYLKNNSLSEK